MNEKEEEEEDCSATISATFFPRRFWYFSSTFINCVYILFLLSPFYSSIFALTLYTISSFLSVAHIAFLQTLLLDKLNLCNSIFCWKKFFFHAYIDEEHHWMKNILKIAFLCLYMFFLYISAPSVSEWRRSVALYLRGEDGEEISE